MRSMNHYATGCASNTVSESLTVSLSLSLCLCVLSLPLSVSLCLSFSLCLSLSLSVSLSLCLSLPLLQVLLWTHSYCRWCCCGHTATGAAAVDTLLLPAVLLSTHWYCWCRCGHTAGAGAAVDTLVLSGSVVSDVSRMESQSGSWSKPGPRWGGQSCIGCGIRRRPLRSCAL